MKYVSIFLCSFLFLVGVIDLNAQEKGATSKKGSVSAPAKLPSAPQEAAKGANAHYGQVPAAKPVYTAPPAGDGYSKLPPPQYAQIPPERQPTNTGYSKMPEAPANRQLNRQNAVQGGLNRNTGGYQPLPNNAQTAGARQGQYQSLPNNAQTAGARYQPLPASAINTSGAPLPKPIAGRELQRQNAVQGGLNRNTGGYQSLPNNSQTAGARQGQYQSLPNNSQTAGARQGQYQQMTKIPAPIHNNKEQRPLKRQNAVPSGLNNNTGGYQALPSNPETNGAKRGHYQTLPKLPDGAPNNTISKPVVPGQSVQYNSFPNNQYDKVNQPMNNSNGTAPRNQYESTRSPLGGNSNGTSPNSQYTKPPVQTGSSSGQYKTTQGLKDRVNNADSKKKANPNKKAQSAGSLPNKKGNTKKVNPNKKGSKSAPKKLPKRRGKG